MRLRNSNFIWSHTPWGELKILMKFYKIINILLEMNKFFTIFTFLAAKITKIHHNFTFFILDSPDSWYILIIIGVFLIADINYSLLLQ